MLRIGDKVRFLNDVGGGIVTGFKNKEIALVEDEDGFEIPVLIRECVVIEASDGPAMTPTSNPNLEDSTTQKSAPVVEYQDKKDLEAYVAISPEFLDNPLEGKMELYLINDSNYYAYYLCEMNGSTINSLGDGLLYPNTHQPLGTYTAQELGEIGKMNVRLLPFKREKAYKKLGTIDKTIGFNAVKLSKSKSYTSTDLLSSPAHLIPIHKEQIEEAVKELKEESLFPKHSSPKSKLKSPKQTSEIVEINLHIEALLDDFTGMSKGEMLEHQLKVFNDTLAQYKNKKGQRIVFIHGVGNGRLKTDIRNSLQRKYKMDFQDASFREYGYGATMVIIR